jgi:hypothetical protein
LLHSATTVPAKSDQTQVVIASILWLSLEAPRRADSLPGPSVSAVEAINIFQTRHDYPYNHDVINIDLKRRFSLVARIHPAICLWRASIMILLHAGKTGPCIGRRFTQIAQTLA